MFLEGGNQLSIASTGFRIDHRAAQFAHRLDVMLGKELSSLRVPLLGMSIAGKRRRLDNFDQNQSHITCALEFLKIIRPCAIRYPPGPWPKS